MNARQEVRLKQTQRMSQFQVQYMSLLALDVIALEARLRDAYLENPFIEEYARPAHPPANADSLALTPAHDREERYRPFLEQLDPRMYTKAELILMMHMIDSLDDSGFYPMTAGETAALFNVPEKRAAKCLRTLRSLEPTGVFSQNLQQCLMFQLEKKGRLTAQLEYVICNHWQELTEGNLNRLSGKTGIPVYKLRQYKSELTTLDPRPFYKPDCRSSRAVIPDVVCTWDGAQWEVSLGGAHDYRISEQYAQLIERSDGAALEYLLQKQRAANDLLAAVALREKTLLSVTRFLTERQSEALARGVAPKPLTMVEAARELGMSQSTVSRTCRGKYIDCPAGVMPMRGLFCSGADADKSASGVQIKQRLLKLIQAEDRATPLSDEQLAVILSVGGMRISRRTVAKYRAELHIPHSYERKR